MYTAAGVADRLPSGAVRAPRGLSLVLIYRR